MSTNTAVFGHPRGLGILALTQASDTAAAADDRPIRDSAAIAAVVLMMLPFIITYAGAMQSCNLLLVWAQDAMDRDLAGFQVRVTWLLTYDGLMTIVGIFGALTLWQRLGGREPDAMIKLAVARVIVALSWSLLALITKTAGGAGAALLLRPTVRRLVGG